MAILPCAVHGSIAHGRARDIRGATARSHSKPAPRKTEAPAKQQWQRCRYEHTSFLLGSVIVQFCVVPSTVSFTFTTFVPSNVTSSRRDLLVAVPPSGVIETAMFRITVPELAIVGRP